MGGQLKCDILKKYTTDPRITDVYKELGECDASEINEQNYTDFEKYYMTFKKDNNGNYYFKSLEAAK